MRHPYAKNPYQERYIFSACGWIDLKTGNYVIDPYKVLPADYVDSVEQASEDEDPGE